MATNENEWMMQASSVNLAPFYEEYGKDVMDQILMFLFYTASTDKEYTPQGRTVSLPAEIDLVWHELIIDEPVYHSLMDALKRVTGKRTWHARRPLPLCELKRRNDKWAEIYANIKPDEATGEVPLSRKRTKVAVKSESVNDSKRARMIDICNESETRFTVKTLTGRTFDVSLKRELAAGLNLKKAIQGLEKIPIDQQRLVCEGKQVEEGYKFPDGHHVVQMVLRLSGC